MIKPIFTSLRAKNQHFAFVAIVSDCVNFIKLKFDISLFTDFFSSLKDSQSRERLCTGMILILDHFNKNNIKCDQCQLT